MHVSVQFIYQEVRFSALFSLQFLREQQYLINQNLCPRNSLTTLCVRLSLLDARHATLLNVKLVPPPLFEKMETFAEAHFLCSSGFTIANERSSC